MKRYFSIALALLVLFGMGLTFIEGSPDDVNVLQRDDAPVHLVLPVESLATQTTLPLLCPIPEEERYTMEVWSFQYSQVIRD